MATMGTTIDTLQVNITANAQSATNALKSLATALNRVKTALTGMKDGATVSSHLSSSLNEMNGALNNINTGSIKKLQKLATALDTYTSAVKNLKSTRGGITASIRDAERALGIKSGSARSKGGRSKVEDGIDPNNPDTYTVDDVVDAKWTKVKQKASMIKGFLKTIGRIALYRAIRSAIKAVAQAFDEGLHNAYYFSKQTGDLSKLAETLDHIKSVTSQMVNQLGSFWGELIQFAAPALEWIANKVREIVEYLTEFFAAMNGDTQWKRAVYVEKSWDDATDKLKEYKHQLLGLDELNNLSKNKDNDKVKQIQDALGDFEYVDVSDKMKGLAGSIQPILKMIQNAIQTIWGIITSPIGLLVGGAILTFFSSHKLLGIGMMAMGAIKLYQKAKEDPDGLYNQIKGFMEKYRWLFVAGAIGLTVVGAALLFTHHYALGLGCILSGVALGATAIAITWEKLYGDLEYMFTQFAPLFALVGVGSMVVGALLLFTGHIGLGLGLLVFGGFLTASTIAFNWDSILDGLKKAWDKIKLWWYNDVKGNINKAANWIEETLGWDINGDGKIGGLQTQFDMSDINGTQTKVTKNSPNLDLLKIKNPSGLIKDFSDKLSKGNIQTEVLIGEPSNPILKDFKNKLKNGAKFDTEVQLGKEPVPAFSTVNALNDLMEETGNLTIQGALGEKAAEYTRNAFKTGMAGHMVDVVGEWFGQEPGWFNPNRKREAKALGGIPSSGSLFYAGESGAEFVGNIGSTSAVANTGQMTDAIYKAAYMGMSKALKENGGGNMSGWEASTTDEIFAVMRKKASNYNKRTGNPAFA